MQIKGIIDAQAELTHNEANNGPIVLSTRIRLARNLSDTPFPGWASQSQRDDILSSVMGSIAGLEAMSGGSRFDISELSALERLILVERHLISRELSESESGSGVFISRDQSCAIMVNEEDHLRVQMLRNGYHFRELWQAIDALDDSIEREVEYAFSPDLGYLTACPTNVGTAIRASAMMHLPALVLSGQMDKVVRAVNQLGIAVRGLFGEGSDASGSIFQISNQQTLGESEEAILKRLGNVLNAVIEQESNARGKLLENDQPRFFDKIGRATGILRHSRLLSSSEAMNLLSLMRLAIDLKAISESHRPSVDRLLIESQPGHVQYIAKAEQESGARDAFRADYIREQFGSVPDPDFSAIDISEKKKD